MSKDKDNTDELFDLKTAFYLGNYQQAINEAQKFKVSERKESKNKNKEIASVTFVIFNNLDYK